MLLFFLGFQINPPDTFGGIAESILNQIMGYSANTICFVPDKRLTPSIKYRVHRSRCPIDYAQN